MSNKQYRPWAPEQAYLLPPDPKTWLSDDHLALFVLELVRDLDLRPIERAIHAKDPRGERPYDPRMMVALWLYAYAVGVHSSRRVARAIVERVDFRVIAGDNRPVWTTLGRFRKNHREAFKHLFVEVLRLCDRMGLVGLGHVAIDGTKVKADASKHKAMSYDRMTREEARLAEEIEALLAASDAVDEEETVRFGDGDGGLGVPSELKRRQDRLARIRQAREALEKEAAEERAETLRQNAANKRIAADARPNPSDPMARSLHTKADRDEQRAEELDGGDDGPDDPPPPTTLPRSKVKPDRAGRPKPKTQNNFTDSDSRIMRGRDGGFIQAFNAQAAVDDEHLVIVAADVTNQAADNHAFGPMLHQTRANLGRLPEHATGDCGYWSLESVESAEALGVQALIPLGRTKRWVPGVGERERPPPPDADARQAMEHRMATEAARRVYRERCKTVEPVFGNIKEVGGFRQFSFRGLRAVAAEWMLVCTAHNLLKAWRAGPLPPA
jgi:transposase